MVTGAIHRAIECHATARPDATALVDARRSLTYRELNASANAVARELMAGGLRRKHLVIVSMPRSCDLAVTLLAVLKAGATYSWIDPAVAREFPSGLFIAQDAEGDERRYLALDVSRVLRQTHRSSPNLPILVRGSDIACALPDAAGEPTVLVPHAAIAGLGMDPMSTTQWDDDPAAFALWLGLVAGATVAVAAESLQTAAA